MNHVYAHLDTPQLLKHILGLSRCPQPDFALVYLYYGMVGRAGSKHESEIQDFIGLAARDNVAVSAITYQDLIVDLLRRGDILSESERETHATYLDYVAARYL